MFLSTKDAGPAPYPNKWLVSYARLHGISPGKEQVAKLDINLGALARANSDGDLILYPGRYQLQLDYDARLVFDFELTGHATLLDTLPRQQARYNFSVPVHRQIGDGPDA
jgi:beta-D-xylosidase 4